MEEKYVIGIGAANFDINGRSINPLIDRDSNPGYMNISIGGVTRNILENVSRIGYHTKLLSAVGDDISGQLILSKSQMANIDVSNVLVVKDYNSSAYLSILDHNGDMKLAISDMHIISQLSVDYIKAKNDLILNSELIIIDPCLIQNSELINYICQTYGSQKPIFCDPVSCSYALAIKPYLQYIHTIKPNELELEILSDHPTKTFEEKIAACQIIIAKGVKRVFVSLGKDGCLYCDNTNHVLTRKFKEVKMVNATGAGDAFMGAIVYSYVNNFPIETTLDYALAAGIVAISSKDTISSEMSLDKLNKIIELERG
ncbi:MAG: carbohydrate kinase family protein [Erysipelotrichaceae bacterium]